MFFILVYSHMFKGLYYGSYMKPKELLWYSGVFLFLLTMGTAFTGYVLPWGQMSFWDANANYKYGCCGSCGMAAISSMTLRWLHCRKPYVKQVF